MIPHTMTTTQFQLEGYEIKRTLGIVRGIIVRSRSVLGTIGANAVVGVHYDATEIMQGVTEVLCFVTAVVAEQKR